MKKSHSRCVRLILFFLCFLANPAFSKKLQIPTGAGCDGKVLYDKNFEADFKKLDEDKYREENPNLKTWPPAFYLGLLRLKDASFKVFYSTGPSCDPSFIFLNDDKTYFDFAGETLRLKDSKITVEQQFNTCGGVMHDLKFSGRTVSESKKEMVPGSKKCLGD
jgi:hypothetical protein